MNLIINWRLIVPMAILAILIAACGNSESTQTDSESNSASITPIEVPTPTVLAEVIASPLGQLLDDYIAKDNPLFSGSILVAREGEVLLSKGYNYADWELKVPNSSQTKFRISSITKPFTGTLIMMLAERDLIDLDARLCTYLPNCPAHWQEITIENLLNHTSGVPEYTTLVGADEVSRDPHSVSALVDLFRNEPLIFSPGDSYQYSHSNYILLGAVIEQVTNGRYGKFLTGALLDPLQMENSGLDIHSQILKDRASGYQILGTQLVNAPYLDMSNAYATAGMYSTVEDLFRWDQALYSNQLLSQENLESMYTPNYAADGTGGEYGYGWQIGEFQGHRKVEHVGGINGFHTYLGRYLDDQVTIILLSNIETEDIDSIVTGMEEIFFNQN
jgi:CubicO group peptidase (beta-lactamase class C family)